MIINKSLLGIPRREEVNHLNDLIDARLRRIVYVDGGRRGRRMIADLWHQVLELARVAGQHGCVVAVEPPGYDLLWRRLTTRIWVLDGDTIRHDLTLAPDGQYGYADYGAWRYRRRTVAAWWRDLESLRADVRAKRDRDTQDRVTHVTEHLHDVGGSMGYDVTEQHDLVAMQRGHDAIYHRQED